MDSVSSKPVIAAYRGRSPNNYSPEQPSTGQTGFAQTGFGRGGSGYLLTYAFLACGVACSVGCGELGQPPKPGQSGAAPSEVSLEIEPEPVNQQLAPIVRFRVKGLPSFRAGETMVIIKGVATPRNITDLRKNAIGDALRKRIVESTVWLTEEGHWELAARQPLQLGEQYSVVSPDIGWSVNVRTMEHDTMPMLRRIWPPVDEAGQYVAWCVSVPTNGLVRSERRDGRLAPGVPGEFGYGALGGIGHDCVSWQAYSGGDVVVPNTVAQLDNGTMARLDPSPIDLDGTSDNWQASCANGEETVGPICVRVMDDRAVVTANAQWLVGFQLQNGSFATAVGPESPWVARMFEPSTQVHAKVYLASVSGETRVMDVDWWTQSPIERVVINEVMARPIGPEPQQEWVELYNDGKVAVDLGGWRFEDARNSMDVSFVVLHPREYALFVGENYDPTSRVDTPPAP
ncbi:MAG: lamin tail domain-containing protein [Polyangiaceae bacterium]|nr:lamin tail domain-containing protein [Polyangiaceae bacterium]